MAMNYIPLGRGRLYLDGYDFGNVTDFKIAVSTEKKEHYSSRAGLKIKDDEMIMSMDATVSFTTDSLAPHTLALFNMGTSADVTETGSVTDEIHPAYTDKSLFLEHKNVSNVIVTDATGTTTYVAGTDYTVNASTGTIAILSGGAIANEDSISVDYSYATTGATKISAGLLTTISGNLRFESDFPAGANQVIVGDVKLAPSGELGLIGDDYLSLAFEGSFIKNETTGELYTITIAG